MALGSWPMALACFVSFLFLVELVGLLMPHAFFRIMVHGSRVFRFLHVLVELVDSLTTHGSLPLVHGSWLLRVSIPSCFWMIHGSWFMVHGSCVPRFLHVFS